MQTLANEDSNLLVLEMDGEVLSDDDSLPLYQSRFLETNIIHVTFLVRLLQCCKG